MSEQANTAMTNL